MHVSPQAVSSCTPNGTACCSGIDENSLGCRVCCTGLYADAYNIKDPTEEKLMQQLKGNLEKYFGYKNNFAQNLEFDPTKKDMSIFRNTQLDNNIFVFFSFSEELPAVEVHSDLLRDGDLRQTREG